MQLNGTFIKDLRSAAKRVKDNWSLCGFMGNCERECMVAQTIHAAILNLGKHNEPFSFRGAGVFNVAGAGLVDNASAYGFLVNQGYLLEEQRDAAVTDPPQGIPVRKGKVVVIFPTRKLLNGLDAFFTRGQRVA